MVFLRTDKRNARRLKLLLDKFSSLCGLTINYHKSEIFFGGATQHHNWIVSHSGLNSGALPVTYLGLPLLPKHLSAGSCAPLIQAVAHWLQSWKAKLLSYVGRVELIKYVVISAMHLYWTSVFLLPSSTLHEIDKLMMGFLWYGQGSKKCVFTSWHDVCQPKDEGGLGIQHTTDCNVAGVLRHFWEVSTCKDALWIKWMRRKYLRGGSIWCTRPPQQA